MRDSTLKTRSGGVMAMRLASVVDENGRLREFRKIPSLEFFSLQSENVMFTLPAFQSLVVIGKDGASLSRSGLSIFRGACT